MAAMLNQLSAGGGWLWARALLLLSVAVYSSYGGGCTFPASWTGSWFQSGYSGLLAVNSTHIQTKGECYESDSSDKFLLYDRSEDCYKCIVIHEKHKYVLQYKETYCSNKDSLSTICEMITGDAPLYSMFRKEPAPVPQPCPFHPAPFTFTYSRGTGECVNPPSRAEACTDDWRLLLRYMACPDVPATESNVEELLCLATWKEGSTRYLVGQISQPARRNAVQSDEETYRCFIYKGQHEGGRMTYRVAQSGDASCNGVSSPSDGSRTITLTTSDDERGRCQFPAWLVEHRSWRSLDGDHHYHFTTRNATLKISSGANAGWSRLVCHSILQQKERKYLTLVAHLTTGCESGHTCVRVTWRARGVLQLQRGLQLWEAPDDACAAPSAAADYVTLVAANLPESSCPFSGRYSVTSEPQRRRRSQHADTEESAVSAGSECEWSGPESVSAGCGHDRIVLKGACSTREYRCLGWWRAGGAGWLVAAADRAACLHYTTQGNDSSLVVSVRVHAADCGGRVLTTYNLTYNGTCEQSSKYSSGARASPAAAILLSAVTVTVIAVR